MNLMRRIAQTSILALCAVLAFAGTVQAQETDDDVGVEVPGVTVIPGELWSTSTTSSTTTAAAGLGIFSMQLATGGRRQFQAYLSRNAVAIQYDLHLGAGELSRDLAELFEIEEEALPRFSQILFERRHELAPLVEPGAIDAERTDQFIEIIVEALASSLEA